MKKKILLTSLVTAMPLMGVLTPLTSCTTTNVKTPLQTKLESNDYDYCPVLVQPWNGKFATADKQLPILDPEDPTEDVVVNLTCDDSSYIVTGIQKVIAHTFSGVDIELIPWTESATTWDYKFEGVGYANTKVRFSSSYLKERIGAQKTKSMTIVPASISPLVYRTTVSSSMVRYKTDFTGRDHEIEDITNGFEVEFHIKDEYQHKYKFPQDVPGFKLKLGRGVVLSDYVDVGLDPSSYTITQKDENEFKLQVKEGAIDLSDAKFDPNANCFYFDVPVVGEKEYGAEIQIFGKHYANIDNCIAAGEPFAITLPYERNKKINKVMWKRTEMASDWQECIVDNRYPGYCAVTPKDETVTIAGNIILNIIDVNAPEKDNAFENETWDDLGFWLKTIYDMEDKPSDTEKGNILAYMYNLNSVDEFLNKTKTVTWGGVEHTVKVASTFQADTVKPDHEDDLILAKDEYDTEHHAAFTFQFANLLTEKTESGKLNQITRRFDNNTLADTDGNCWVEDCFAGGHTSSDIRKFLNKHGSSDFPERFSNGSECIKDIVRPTASIHYTRAESYSVMLDSKECICDRFFIPTARQVNCLEDPVSNSTWYTEREGAPTFEIYNGYDKTNGSCEFRQYRPISGDLYDYWLATPCTNDGHDYDNDLTVTSDGTLRQKDYNSHKGILPCFCL